MLWKDMRSLNFRECSFMFREFVGVEPVLMSQKIQKTRKVKNRKTRSRKSRFGTVSRDILRFL